MQFQPRNCSAFLPTELAQEAALGSWPEGRRSSKSQKPFWVAGAESPSRVFPGNRAEAPRIVPAWAEFELAQRCSFLLKLAGYPFSGLTCARGGHLRPPRMLPGAVPSLRQSLVSRSSIGSWKSARNPALMHKKMSSYNLPNFNSTGSQILDAFCKLAQFKNGYPVMHHFAPWEVGGNESLSLSCLQCGKATSTHGAEDEGLLAPRCPVIL